MESWNAWTPRASEYKWHFCYDAIKVSLSWITGLLKFVQTLYTTSIRKAAEVLRHGGLVAFPTETVYGLGADIFNAEAVEGIFRAKNRPGDNPLIAHVADQADVSRLAKEVSPAAERLIEAFFPGPLTIVLKRNFRVPDAATAGLETIGIRMPLHETAIAFLKACGTPVAAPSANLSGRPSPTTWRAVREDLDGRVDCVLKGGSTDIGIESTVVDCSEDVPMVLRSGAISLDQIRSILPDAVSYSSSELDIAQRSPGMKHRHYSPHARVQVIDTGEEAMDEGNAAFIGLNSPPWCSFVRVCDSVEEYAGALFEFFRECDRRGIDTIYCQRVDVAGIGFALMDRINRAAAG